MLESRVPLVLVDPREDVEQQVHLECLVLRDRRVASELMDLLDLRADLDRLGHLEIVAHLACQDLLDLLELGEPWVLRERGESLANLVRRDLMDQLDFLDLQGLRVRGVPEERRVPLESLEPLALLGGQETRDHLDQLELWDLLEDLVFQ